MFNPRSKQKIEYSELKKVNAGVLQGSMMGLVFYVFSTRDIPVIENINLPTFAEDTPVLVIEDII